MIPNDDGNSRVQVTSGLQVFGLDRHGGTLLCGYRVPAIWWSRKISSVMTRPAASIPSTTKFDLIEKGQYTQHLTPDQLPANTADKKVPLQLLEAQNAIAIATAAGADQYAVDTLGKAKAFLAQGQDYYRRKQGITPIGAVSRAAAQSAGRRTSSDHPEKTGRSSLPQKNRNLWTASKRRRLKRSSSRLARQLLRRMPDTRLNSVL